MPNDIGLKLQFGRFQASVIPRLFSRIKKKNPESFLLPYYPRPNSIKHYFASKTAINTKL